MDYEIVDQPSTRRVELRLDGVVAGFATYSREEQIVSVPHVEIDPRWRGHGLGAVLARGVLEVARDRGWSVLPYCPFLRDYLVQHSEYLDLVPVADRSRFALPVT